MNVLHRIAVGGWLVWLAFVVLLVVGRYTPLPSFDAVHSGVVFGTAVLTLIGSARLARSGYRRVTG
ncbi:hypothetical protein [Halorubrum cibi]|uniref:Uncharacterized protein n=1 Tax=Halorubrum cibi TaxID=413815 RepID=A0A521EIG1_9EURY|nr:hypothetical protein [Halorubrum cibi]SMO82940.1 hypothetical protein SAMN06264867_110144 [Halorubrum cibi]